ncbi:hypothetical protein ASZ90_008521 [hydrocarbon metagenome]|uniref:Lipoprotein n=1 Tax=hydrocarbon metagenome TaxID=938273 RepID=A0A0W8FLB1_9ZZZZ
MKAIRLLLVLALIGLFGCSLQSVNLKPQMNAKNLKAAKAGTVVAEKEFNFKDCSASAEQKDLVLSIQSKIAGLYDKLLQDKISLKAYNQKVQTANDALNKVSLACAAKSKALAAAKPDKKAIAKADMNLGNVWKNLKQVDQKL